MKDNNVKSENKNKKILWIIIFIILLLLLCIITVIGATRAYYSLMSSEKEDATQVKVGDLAIDFIDGQVVSPLLVPREEPTFEETKYVYRNNFSVKALGSLDQSITIYLDIKTNEFRADAIKYAIYDTNNDRVALGGIGSTGNIVLLTNKYLASGATQNYTLLLWLQDDGTNQDYEQGNRINASLRVEGVQVKY